MTKPKEIKPVQVTMDEKGSTAVMGGSKIEISSEGNVVIFTNKAVQAKPATTSSADFSISKDFNAVTAHGVKIELANDGSLIVSATGTVQIKPATSADTAIQAAQDALKIGQTIADGSIYAGLTKDGKSQIFAMPHDLDKLMTYNDAVAHISWNNGKKSLGHNDWRIPDYETLQVLEKNKNEGDLKGTFNSSAAGVSTPDGGKPDWYWSSSESELGEDNDYGRYARQRDRRDRVTLPNLTLHFSSGCSGDGYANVSRMACRPVRLVPVK